MEKSVIKSIIRQKRKDLDEKLEKARIALELRTHGAPRPRMNEVALVRKIWDAFLEDNIDAAEIRKMVSALPMAVVHVPVLDTVLLPVLELIEQDTVITVGPDGSEVEEPLVVIRKNDKAPWELYWDVFERMNPNPDTPEEELLLPQENGYMSPITDASAYVRCVGWSRLISCNIEEYHPCGDVFLTTEAWHRYRCPVCTRALQKARNKKVRNGGKIETTMANLHKRRIKRS
jgi:hypothetical protein